MVARQVVVEEDAVSQDKRLPAVLVRLQVKRPITRGSVNQACAPVEFGIVEYELCTVFHVQGTGRTAIVGTVRLDKRRGIVEPDGNSALIVEAAALGVVQRRAAQFDGNRLRDGIVSAEVEGMV